MQSSFGNEHIKCLDTVHTVQQVLPVPRVTGYHSAYLSPFPWCSRRQLLMVMTTIIKISIRMMTTLVVLVLVLLLLIIILTIIIVIAIIIITCRAKIWLCAVTGILESCSNFAAK